MGGSLGLVRGDDLTFRIGVCRRVTHGWRSGVDLTFGIDIRRWVTHGWRLGLCVGFPGRRLRSHDGGMRFVKGPYL